MSNYFDEQDKSILKKFEVALKESLEYKISRLKTIPIEHLHRSQGEIQGLEQALEILTNIKKN